MNIIRIAMNAIMMRFCSFDSDTIPNKDSLPILLVEGPRQSGRIVFIMCPYCRHEHAHRLTNADLNEDHSNPRAADCGLGEYIFRVTYPEEHVPPHFGPGIL